MTTIKCQEDGVCHFMATNSKQMLKYITEIIGDFEYVERAPCK